MLKTALRDAVHSAVLMSRSESSLAVANGRAPDRVQEAFFRRICPPPKSFVGSSPRHVRRHGLAWELDLSDYFQWHQYFGFRDEVLDTILVFAPESRLFVDVGANIGFYSTCAAAAAPHLRVRAFEANPVTAAKLRRHLDMNQIRSVEVDCVGVAEHPGEAVLRDHGGGEPGKYSLRAGGTSGHRVRLQPIDVLLGDDSLVGPALVKIDVEGFEPEVLLGSGRFLASARPRIVFEWTIDWLAGKGEAVARVQALLHDLQYRLGVIVGARNGTVQVRPFELGDLARSVASRNLLAFQPGDPLVADS